MIDQIRKLKRAIPFQPFEIVLSSGTILRVPSPEHLALCQELSLKGRCTR